jgi:hypothetical protein
MVDARNVGGGRALYLGNHREQQFMATNNRGKARRTKTSRKASNPQRRSQRESGWLEGAKDKPLAAAIGAAAAVGAGVFLWSRRNQISGQIDSLADQVREVRDSGVWNSDGGNDGRSQREIAEEALTLKEIGAQPEANQPLA